MAGNPIEGLNEFGQSAWLDNINRAMIKSGKLAEWIKIGLRGMTSNPSIFEKAICKSTDYDDEIEKLKGQGKSVFDIYDDLTVRDIKEACDMYRPIYEASDGLDGYVSLEINPKLAYKTEETIAEGKRLSEKIDRANLMLKVPATDEGFPAVDELVGSGINVNVTLIFSVQQYIKTAEAYIRGVKNFIASAGDPGQVASVASVFVSRVDTSVDKILDAKIAEEGDSESKKQLTGLRGKAAVANASLIYARYLEIIGSEQFRALKQQGVRPQRVLWGSTSTKNPSYSDTKYVTELIAKGTVNTLPDKTFEAFFDHGVVEEALTSDASDARRIITDLQHLGISVDRVCEELLEKGVKSFEDAFDSLLGSIGSKVG